MGLLKSAFRRWRRLDNAEKQEFVDQLADAMMTRVVGRTMSDEELRELEEREQAEKEGLRIRRERLEAAGVDVGMFTDAKAERDAMAMLAEFVPQTAAFPMDSGERHVGVDFKNLTKTGKIPKNVAKANVWKTWPIGEREYGMIVSNITYMKDGSANLVDLHVWGVKCGVGVSARIYDGRHEIAYVVLIESDTDVRTTLYSRDAGDADPRSAVAKAFETMERKGGFRG